MTAKKLFDKYKEYIILNVSDTDYFIEEGDFIKAGVLELWFEPVHSEIKKTFALKSSQGKFQLEVDKTGIFYSPERTFLNVEKLKEIITPKSIQDNSYEYKQHVEFVNLGCKTAIPVYQISEVLTYFESL